MDNKKKLVYIAGDMLNTGAQLIRSMEKKWIELIGFLVHAPQDDEEINDKEKAVLNGLAEKIVKKDTAAIMNADIIVMDVLVHAQGTLIELGQILGMRDLSELIMKEINHIREDDNITYHDVLGDIEVILLNILKKKVYCQCTDIRRNTLEPEQGDRRSYGNHQYAYGAVLKVTDGVGFRSIEEILKELKNDK